jgi:glycosyltransferase involved in cell wall biosynthesis
MQPDTKKPGVSVVIPAYNYAHYLPRTLDSILKQDYPNVEIVVVDDGSTDNTREIVASYGDKIRYVYQQNAGLSAARNTGIKEAKFEYLGFIDADDEWRPTLISRIMGAFQRLPGEFAIVACHYDYIDADSKPLPVKNLIPIEEREFNCRDFILKTRFTSSSAIITRKAFDTCGTYDVTLRSSEDRDIWIRIASKFRVYIVGERLSLIRRHPHNMSKHADRMKQNIRRVLQKTYHAKLASHADVLFWAKVLSFYFYQNSWRYRDEGRNARALAEIVKSLLLWPAFPQPERLNEPSLFRVRSTLRFARELIAGKATKA